MHALQCRYGPGTLGVAELEGLCQQAAQRLSLLYAPAAPEFFDKTLFRGFIQKLRELKLVWPDEHSKLVFGDKLDVFAKDAKFILSRELRHTIEKVSPEASPAPADAAPAAAGPAAPASGASDPAPEAPPADPAKPPPARPE